MLSSAPFSRSITPYASLPNITLMCTSAAFLFASSLPASVVYTIESFASAFERLTVRVMLFAALSMLFRLYVALPTVTFFRRISVSAALSVISATVKVSLPASWETSFVSIAWRMTFASVDSTKTTPNSLPISPEYMFSAPLYLETSCHRLSF